MGVVGWADRFQRRRPWVGLPLGVAYKFFDDQGGYLTALIAYYGFVSVFPLLLLLVTILGFALQGNPGLQERLLDSALAQFPVIGEQIGGSITSLQGSVPGVVIGVLGSLYGGLGVIQAVQNALNKIWGVPRNARLNPILSRLRSLVLLAVGGAGVAVTTVLSAMSVSGGRLGGEWRAVTTAFLIALNIALFSVAYRALTSHPATFREVLPGAVLAALIWQSLQWAGSYLVGHTLQNATATYGLFGVVLGLLTWIYLAALTLVVSAELNTVLARRLWPRSLMTPFTDDVDLTRADEAAYTSYAETERHKGFENIDVGFDESETSGRQE